MPPLLAAWFLPRLFLSSSESSRMISSSIMPWWAMVIIVLLLGWLTWWTYRLQWSREIEAAADRTLLGLSSRWTLILAFALRILAIAIVVWMSGIWNWQRFQRDRSELWVLIDASASMDSIDLPQAAEDDDADRGRSRIELVLQSLSPEVQRRWLRDYRVRYFSIGQQMLELGEASLDDLDSWQANLPRSESRSRLGDGLREAMNLAAQREVAAMLVLTDGINTDGEELSTGVIRSSGPKPPVFFVGVGQPPRNPDLRLRDVLVEEVVFLGDQVRWDAVVERQDLDRDQCVVRLIDQESDRVLQQKNISFVDGSKEQRVSLQWLSESIGVRKLTLMVDVDEAEIDRENNEVSRTVEIRDAAIPVLMVFGQPSYEFRFLKHLLERGRQPGSPDKPAFQLTTILEQAEPGYVEQDASARPVMPVTLREFQAFDVVILGDVSTNLLSSNLQKGLSDYVGQHGGGLMVIAGPAHMPFDYQHSELGKLLPIDLDRIERSLADQPFRWRLTRVGQEMSALRLEPRTESNERLWSQLPIMRWRCGPIHPHPIALVLARTRSVSSSQASSSNSGDRTHSNPLAADMESGDPLLVLEYAGAGRVAFQATDETFQWQSYRGDDTYYQRYWVQMIRWLSRNRSLQQRQAELNLPSRPYRENEVVEGTLHLEGKPDSDRKQSTSDEFGELRLDREGQIFRRIELTPIPDEAMAYRFAIKGLPSGRYRLEWNDAEHAPTLQREFEVVKTAAEKLELNPDFASMEKAAEMAQGKLIRLKDLPSLAGFMPKVDSTRPQPLPPIPIWNRWYVVGALIGLLTAEWLIRRRVGLS